MRKLIIMAAVLMLTCSVVYAEEENKVMNGGFEEGLNHWSVTDNSGRDIVVVNEQNVSGDNALMIRNIESTDTIVFQEVDIESETVYEVSVKVMADIDNQRGAANISLYYTAYGYGGHGIYTSPEVMDSQNEWTEIRFSFKSLPDNDYPFFVGLRLGGQGIGNTGTVYYDDFTVRKIQQPLERHFEFIPVEETQVDEGSVEDVSSGTGQTYERDGDIGKVDGIRVPRDSDESIEFLWVVFVLASFAIAGRAYMSEVDR